MNNEKRLIDANALLDTLLGHFGVDLAYLNRGLQFCQEAIEFAPTVDAVEVVHGRWIGTHDGWYYSYSCSECGAEALTKEETMHDQVCSAYCPNCGAKMDGDGNA